MSNWKDRRVIKEDGLTALTGNPMEEIKRKKSKKSQTWLSYAEEDWLIQQVDELEAENERYKDLIIELQEYFSDRMDGDGDSLGHLPNEEMKKFMLIEDVLKPVKEIIYKQALESAKNLNRPKEDKPDE